MQAADHVRSPWRSHAPWENPEPQGMKVNGNEVITTKSVLMCRKSAGPFEIRSSGQDHKFAEQILFIKEMEAKHPGLRAILDSPDGSLYLNEGMYRTAIDFLGSRMKANGGGIDLCIIEDKESVEGCYIKSALAHLEPGLNMESIGTFCDGIENAASRYGAAGQAGIDEHVLNGAMLDLLKRDSEEMDRRIKAGGFYRWQEEHKRGLRLASDWMMGSEFSVLMAVSAMVGPVNAGSKEEYYEGGSGALENTLTDAQKSRLNSLENTINDHLTEGDFSGTLRDLQGNPVPNGRGGYFDHLGEMKDSYKSLLKVKKGLEGSLKNPNLTSVDKALLQEASDKANYYITRIEELFDPFGGIN